MGGEPRIGPTTCFLPKNRVQRIDLDESTTVLDSYGDRYRTSCGREVRDALMDDGGIDA